jgi:hypothetical protein
MRALVGWRLLINPKSPPSGLLRKTLTMKAMVGFERRSKTLTMIRRQKPEEREIWCRLFGAIAQILLKAATLT